jgi:hypothetical protein
MSHSLTNTAYSVPARFGIAAMLAFTTLFAMLSGVLRFYDAPVSAYAFFGVLGVAVCGAQMWNKDVPRMVSVGAGAILLPVFVIGHSFLNNDGMLIGAAPCLAIPGAIVGYLMGAVSAGVFLVSDMLEQRWRGEAAYVAELADEPLPPGTPVYTADSCTPYLGEEAAKVAGGATVHSDATSDPRVKKIGPPVGVPVYNCIALVSRRGADGLVHARAANVADLRTSGASEREALQHLVGAFKIIVAQCVAEGRPPPLLEAPHAPQPEETERLIAVHL